jgi:hypothetical protein
MTTFCIAFFESYLSTLPPFVSEYMYRKQYPLPVRVAKIGSGTGTIIVQHMQRMKLNEAS